MFQTICVTYTASYFLILNVRVDLLSAVFAPKPTHHRAVMLGGVCLRCRVVCKLVRLCRGSPVDMESGKFVYYIDIGCIFAHNKDLFTEFDIYPSNIKLIPKEFKVTFTNFYKMPGDPRLHSHT